MVVRWLASPRPPPSWPTIMSEVGTLLCRVPAVNAELLVRLMVRAWPVGTVITTGDQPPPAAGFNAAQVALSR